MVDNSEQYPEEATPLTSLAWASLTALAKFFNDIAKQFPHE